MYPTFPLVWFNTEVKNKQVLRPFKFESKFMIILDVTFLHPRFVLGILFLHKFHDNNLLTGRVFEGEYVGRRLIWDFVFLL